MSTYRALKGYNIKKIASDPANPKEGQIWYNSTSATIKLQPLVKAWASGGALSTGRHHIGGAGTQTAALGYGGTAGSNEAATVSEEYNGSAWAEGNNLNTGRNNLSSIGIQTAAVAAGGHTGTAYINNSEESGII